jgi:hypothetical protein
MKIVEVSGQQELRLFASFGAEMSCLQHEGFKRTIRSELALWDPAKNFFFGQGGQAVGFLVLSHDKVVGRIAAMQHPYMMETMSEAGLIGLYECIDDEDVAKVLLTAACDRLRSWGCKTAIGPIDFSIWHNYRFMTKGFGSYILMGEPRNPAYYPTQWTQSGFQSEAHWTTYLYDQQNLTPIPESLTSHETLFNSIGYQTIFMKGISDKLLMKEVYRLLMPSYRTFPLYIPLSEKEFMKHYSYMPSLINKVTSFYLRNPAGDTVGFGAQYHDFNPAIQAMGGRSGLLGKIRFLMHKNTENVAIIAQGGTLTQYSREALELGKAHGGAPLSLGRVGLAKSLKYSIESGQYRQYAITLVRDQALHKKHIPQNTTETREYTLFHLTL